MRALRVVSVFLFAVAAAVALGQQKLTLLEQSLEILRAEQIQKEVKVTPSQMKAIEDAFGRYRKALQEAIEKNKATKNVAAVKAVDAAQLTRLRNFIIDTLDRPQKDRLRQLWVQFVGVPILIQEEAASEVGLTPAQVSKLKSVYTQFQKEGAKVTEVRMKELRAIPQPKNPKDKKAVEAYQKKVQALVKKYGPGDRKLFEAAKKKTETQMLAVLTPAQKTKYTAMQGKKYAFPDTMQKKPK
ncbi:MAG: hypothetical protein HZC36_13980 [Armatimonadetes bacterium]|nr:hypothetical protein [Armatimonadota bacterium]